MESKPDKEAIQQAISDLIMDAAIAKAIEDKRELLNPSMKHFIYGGNVNGEFDIALKKLMRWVEKKTIEALHEYSASQNEESEQDELWKDIENIFDKHTSPTGGGYEADYTYKDGFISESKEKYHLIKK